MLRLIGCGRTPCVVRLVGSALERLDCGWFCCSSAPRSPRLERRDRPSRRPEPSAIGGGELPAGTAAPAGCSACLDETRGLHTRALEAHAAGCAGAGSGAGRSCGERRDRRESVGRKEEAHRPMGPARLEVSPSRCGLLLDGDGRRPSRAHHDVDGRCSHGAAGRAQSAVVADDERRDRSGRNRSG